MKHIKNIACILFGQIVEIPVRIKGKRYGLRIQIGPFIQAVQPKQMGTPGSYVHSVLIQPFKEFKHNG